MKIVIINKSDSKGGAAIVSRRLMEALREEGVDARMLVVDKGTDSPYVEVAASWLRKMVPFVAERLEILKALKWQRRKLFQFDTASYGLPLWKHPLVKEADAVFLNWINQGMLSLKGIRKIVASGKPVIWTMHDMWCMTGVCHHAGDCVRYRKEYHPACKICLKMAPDVGKPHFDYKDYVARRKYTELPEDTAFEKMLTYFFSYRPRFVAVSNWLARRAAESELLSEQDVRVIPNAFPVYTGKLRERKVKTGDDKVTLLFGAARLDDSIKGLDVLVEATGKLRDDHPDIGRRLEIVTFGGVKDATKLEGFAIPHRHLGVVSGEDAVREVYESADILVSSSSYETLPGTLVEAQAYGCIPVSFNNGGQGDIVDHKETGYIADQGSAVIIGEATGEDARALLDKAAGNLAEGIVWAVETLDDPVRYPEMLEKMRRNVAERFSPRTIARKYLEILKS